MKNRTKKLYLFLSMAALSLSQSMTALAVSEADVEAVGKETAAGNMFIWFLCAIAFLKISQKIDSFLSSLGINVGHTGGNMIAELMVAAKGITTAKNIAGGSSFRGGSFRTGGTSSSVSQSSFLSGGLAGAVGRQFTQSAMQAMTGRSGNPISRRAFESSVKKGGDFANGVTGAVAKGSISYTGSMTGAQAAQALTSYMGQTGVPDAPSYSGVPVLFLLMLPSLIFGGLDDASPDVLNDNERIMENIAEAEASIEAILRGKHDALLDGIQWEADALGTGCEYGITDDFSDHIIYESALVISQFCASQDNYQEISLAQLERMLRDNADGIFTYTVEATEHDETDAETGETRTILFRPADSAPGPCLCRRLCIPVPHQLPGLGFIRGTPGDGSSPAFPDGSPAACPRALVVFPYSLYGIALCLGVSGLLIFMVMRMGFGRKGTYDRERNLTYSDLGTYGTSGFMTDAEMREVLELIPDISKSRGVILGKLNGKAVCLPEKTRMNRNVAVFGASGSMKS